MDFQITSFKHINKGDTLIRWVAGKPTSIGKVFMVSPQPKGAIVLITDEGHRLIGQPDQMVLRSKGGNK